jgi:hypothetical protein
MNGRTVTENKDNQKSAVRQVLNIMRPYLSTEKGRKKERSLMKYAILLSEAELNCIVRLCKQAVVSDKRRRPKAKAQTASLF